MLTCVSLKSVRVPLAASSLALRLTTVSLDMQHQINKVDSYACTSTNRD